jgi:hypothetical protein
MAAIAQIGNANPLLGRELHGGGIPWQITKRSGNCTAGSHLAGVPNKALGVLNTSFTERNYMKKTMILVAIVLVACFAFAQKSPSGQGSTILNGGIPESWINIAPGAGPNGVGGPGLGRHDLYDGNTGLPLGCESCHLPHTAPSYGTSFLWAWKTVPSNITTYTTDTNPSGALITPVGRTANTRSMLCFTCHDGASASSNGITGNVVLQGAPFALIQTVSGSGSISNEHPVDALVPVNPDYQGVTTVATSLSASADSVSAYIGATGGPTGFLGLPLWGTDYRVECTSCHDQHNDWTTNNGYSGGVPFLRVANTNGVQLCRACHNQ